MSKRRETFLLVPVPGRSADGQQALSDWLRKIDDYPGFLGGSVLKESSNELLPDTFVLQLEFESTEAARPFWRRVEKEVNPIYPDDKSTNPPDQGAVIFEPRTGGEEADERLDRLAFDQGGALFAQLLHIHAHVVDEYTATRAANGQSANVTTERSPA